MKHIYINAYSVDTWQLVGAVNGSVYVHPIAVQARSNIRYWNDIPYTAEPILFYLFLLLNIRLNTCFTCYMFEMFCLFLFYVLLILVMNSQLDI